MYQFCSRYLVISELSDMTDYINYNRIGKSVSLKFNHIGFMIFTV